MDERTIEISELYTRILQLERLQETRISDGAMDAIQDHLAILRQRLLELKCVQLPRTNA